GERWRLQRPYSHEGPEPLATGGGMLHALPRRGSEPFLAVKADIWSAYDSARLPREPPGQPQPVLGANAAHRPDRDFALPRAGSMLPAGEQRLTFSGIGLYRPALLRSWRSVIGAAAGAELVPPRFRLAPLLRAAMRAGQVTGEHHRGTWTDVGTPDRLAALG